MTNENDFNDEVDRMRDEFHKLIELHSHRQFDVEFFFNLLKHFKEKIKADFGEVRAEEYEQSVSGFMYYFLKSIELTIGFIEAEKTKH